MLSNALLFAAKANQSGILTADRYFRSIEGCFDGFCPVKFFDEATPEQWAKELESATARLVYADDEMEVKDLGRSGASLSPGSVMDFDCIITSTLKDRDGDILESAGAIVDPKCPLLWQHIPLQPIGKLVSITAANSKTVQGRFAIADIPLGRDAAVLVEMQALRISHGFEPLAYEPIEKDGRWHITKFNVLEVSLVSVPSNVDAVITAFSRDKLHSPLIKGWAEKAYRDRPVQGKGYEVGGSVAATKDRDAYAVGETWTSATEKTACTCGKKETAVEVTLPAESKSYGALTGSYEAIREELHNRLKKHLTDSSVSLSDDDYAYIVGTYSDHVIACACLRDAGEEKHYRIAWKMENGEPTYSGDPQEVELKLSVEAKGRVAPKAPEPVSYAASAEKCIADAGTNLNAAKRLYESLGVILEQDATAKEYEGVAELLEV